MNNRPTVFQTGMKYGIIIGLISIILSAVQYLAALERNTTLTVIGIAILVGGIYLAHKYFKEQGDGFMRYGQGLGIGTLVAGFSGVLSGIFNYIYLAFVDDSLLSKTLNDQRIKFEEQGMSDEQIDQAMKITEQLSTPGWTIVWIIVFSLLFGFLISLIVSAITKKVDPQEAI